MTNGILFCTPMFGGQCTEQFATAFVKLVGTALSRLNLSWDWLTLTNESLITRARNHCVTTFLSDTNFSHLMFIDADIVFTPDDMATIWNLDADVAAGCYPIKKPGAPYALWIKGRLVHDLNELTGPVEVDYAGTGFMLIKRSVFEKIIKAHPKIAHWEGEPLRKAWAVFDTEIVGTGKQRCYLSEDYLFCRRWRALGGKIIADPQVRLKHVGQFVYG